MNRILRYFLGKVELELVSAEPAAALTYYAAHHIRFQEPQATAPLTIHMTMDFRSWKRMEPLAQQRGDRCIVLNKTGFLVTLRRVRRRWPFFAALLLLLTAALYAPTRIWFVQVEGNTTVPGREILAAAEDCGVHFWARSKEIRSEKVKNQLLNLVPELEWAGVNFSGGIATVSVRERMTGEEVRDRSAITNVIAARDGVIISMSVLGGEAVCQVGQAVRAGELLVSGCIECPSHTQYTHADAEIYALTQREVTAVYPAQWTKKAYTGKVNRSYSLLIGKKRINLFGNSGISDGSCDKMTEIKTLRLPGGLSLPVSLVVETVRTYEAEPLDVLEATAQEALSSYTRAAVAGDMIAGEIFQELPSYSQDQGVFQVDVTYACREMIARQRVVDLFEGEITNDGTNRERGARGGPYQRIRLFG